MGHILLVEDEPELVVLLSRILRMKNFRVSEASSGSAGLRAALDLDPDLVILDLMLPDIRGEDLLVALLAARPDSRVLVLSAATQIAVRVHALDCGAVDFVTKPFATAELLARIQLRMRADRDTDPQPAQCDRYLCGAGLQVDLERREIAVDGCHVKLSDREFVLLNYLLHRISVACSRADLLAGVWGTQFEGTKNVVDVYIKRLRSKLPSDKIETVRNVGYRLVE